MLEDKADPSKKTECGSLYFKSLISCYQPGLESRVSQDDSAELGINVKMQTAANRVKTPATTTKPCRLEPHHALCKVKERAVLASPKY